MQIMREIPVCSFHSKVTQYNANENQQRGLEMFATVVTDITTNSTSKDPPRAT
jgi:hypothetical protein